MIYCETFPDDIFSRHVESYWKVVSADGESELELLLPTCTFDFIFVDGSFMLSQPNLEAKSTYPPGVYFVGQLSSILKFKFIDPIKIVGIRLKPFALANIIKKPLYKLNDSIYPLSDLITVDKVIGEIESRILSSAQLELVTPYLDQFVEFLLYKSLDLDENLRSQLNYILDRHGDVRVGDLLDTFGVSKVTLRKHFIHKVGFTPKKITQIWRMNRVLQLKEDHPNFTLTDIGLESGYYDQSHFIKDFRAIFGVAPKSFFRDNAKLISIAHQNISRRFSNVYDPRIV